VISLPRVKATDARKLLAGILCTLAAVLSLCARAQEPHAEYRLRAGDVVSISVFQNADLKLDTRITESGNISYPLIGVIRIGGMTIAAAEQAIAKALSDGGFVNKPQVTISLKSMRGNIVSVLGQVSKPGRFELETVNLRVTDLLSMAGGISKEGADIAILTGTRDGKPLRKEIDIAGIFLDDRRADNLFVADGDAIYVHRAPVFYIYGEVGKAGTHRVERGMTIRQALAQAGGPSTRGTERRLLLYRRGAGGTIERLSPDLNDPVLPDDVFYVRESLL